jgi:hypothetical protein
MIATIGLFILRERGKMQIASFLEKNTKRLYRKLILIMQTARDHLIVK